MLTKRIAAALTMLAGLAVVLIETAPRLYHNI